MTTESDTGIEVNGSEQSEIQNEQTESSNEQDHQNSNEQDHQKAENAEVTESPGNPNPGEPEQVNAIESPSSPTSPGQKSPGKPKKEAHESKGISRFLPPWLKKQKSLSQSEPKEERTDQIDGSPEGTEEKEEEVNNKDEMPAEDKPVETTEESPEKKTDADHTDVQVSTEENKEVETQEVFEKEDKREEEKEIKEKLPAGIKKEIPSKSPKKVKTVPCKVMLLDKTEYSCEIEKRAKGQSLFVKVCDHLNLLETDYFGLIYSDNAEQKNWLDPAKEIKRQIRNSPWQFVFNVKFYPPDPSQLTEDITRYYLCLQLRQDVASGRLPCSFVTHALLGSLTLQAEVGDYDADEHTADYINDFQFAPNQTKELEDKIVDLHKTHRGLTPAQADAAFLENAKKLSMYGVDLHHAKDSEAVDIMLGVCANGLLIYKDRLRINRFAWPKILKISYKRSNFFIKVRPGELEQFESTIGFKLPNHRAAKRLWKVCVEHHTFYRLSSPEQPPKARFLTLGSKFRYSGRTQAQTREASTRIDRPAPYFERTSSKRVSRSLDGAPIGSITDQSLLRDASVSPGDSGVDGLMSGSMAAIRESQDGISTPSAPSVFPNDTKPEKEEDDTAVPQDLDKSQDEILRHQASISELKRTFMESTPEPRPNEWEKRCITPLPLQTHGSLEEEITSILFNKERFPTLSSSNLRTTEGSVLNASVPSDTCCVSHSPPLSEKLLPRTRGMRTGLSDALENSDEIQNVVEEKKQADSDYTNATVKEDLKAGINGDIEPHNDVTEPLAEVKELDKNDTQSVSSYDSSSESENEEVEYKAEGRSSEHVIPEEPDESAEDVKEVEPVEESQTGEDHTVTLTVTEIQEETEVLSQEITVSTYESEEKVEEKREVHIEEQSKLNGDVSHIDVDASAQIICCSEPPVVKTEMVTISDATQRTEISTKEVPIVQTETKTITFESAQLDGGGDSEPGILLSAQTITSDSVLTTTTTHITKTGKGGISETRIEKRIVISGDADIDHDEALAQAIKEAKEQHPDMSITRVVVHKETEVTEEGEDA
ncbi:band 4.1-like protein 2 isoform X8 [Anomaloglossus baeobatrachus]|uniref:band 4.1-like protein 2 isoform X8 n=1 Tax=Anomaloglossus baeobatrachus TaxID=238106 RepID=UPI003F4F7AF0